MASSGSFNTSAYSNRHLTFSWTTKVVTIESNYTVINWTLKGAGSASGYYMAAPFRVVIDGETVYSSSTRIELRNGTTVASGEKVISHNADGSRKFSASVTAAIYSYAENVSGSGSWALDTIPRAATITSAPNFNDEENPVLKYSNLAGSSATTLQACISLDGSAASIAYRDISKTGTSYTFSLTTAERETLRNATTTANSRNVYFMVKTVIGSNTYTNKIKKTLTIVNATPTISATITDTNTTTTNITGNSNTLVKGLSNAKVTTGAAALKGATIKSQSITCGNKKLTANGTINAVESGTFKITVTDSRGNTTTKTYTKTFVEYFKPNIYVTSTDITTDGKVTVTISGSVYNGKIGSYDNGAKHIVSYNYLLNTGEYESMVSTVTPTYSGNNFTATISLTGLNYQSTYLFRGYISDAFYSVAEESESIGRPVFEWGKDVFAVNAIKTEGNYYGLGRLTQIPEDADLNDYKEAGVYGIKSSDLASSLKNKPIAKSGKLIVYSSLGMGMTGIDAYITQEYIPMDLKYPVYKRRIHTSHTSSSDWTYTDWIRQGGAVVLWSGLAVMDDGHKATLSEPISSQPNGVVFRFVKYENGASLDTNYNEYFVSKDFIANHNAKGHTFAIWGNNFNSAATKYLYINDQTIVGNAANVKSGTLNGITYNNNAYVLCEVIGV